MSLLTLFIILNIVNVILQTAKSIATVKCGKEVAALVNALSYGLYTVVIVYTNCDLALWAKVAVVASTNLIGVYMVKLVEEKLRKDKLWKIEATIPSPKLKTLKADAEFYDLSYTILPIDERFTLVNFYCKNQSESRTVSQILKDTNAKYFVTESKSL